MPGWATPAGIEAGIEEAEPGIFAPPPTDAAAGEGLPRNDLDRSEAEELVSAVFGDLLNEPAGIYDDLEVEKFHSDYVAVIDPDAPGGTGQRPGLLSSMLPLRDENADGVKAAVDLSLGFDGGVLQPENPLVEVEIPAEIGEGISLPEVGITIDLVDAPDGRAPSNLEGTTAFYPNVAEDSDLVVLLTPTGVETSTVLRSIEAPDAQRFRLALPAGAHLEATADGGAVVTEGSRKLLTVPPPSAFDAEGDSVTVELEVSGDSISVQASPGPGDALPILVDPIFESYYWNQYPNDQGPEWIPFSSRCLAASWAAWMLPGLKMYSCSGGWAEPGTQANWNYYVPRFFTDFNNPSIKERPTSYIKQMTMSRLFFTFGTPAVLRDPSIMMGLWSENKGQWVSVATRNGFEGQLTDPNYVYSFINPAEVTDAKNGGIALYTMEPSFPTQRDVVVEQATVELSDKDNPEFGILGSASGWLRDQPTAPINYQVSDPGLGVFELQVQQPNAAGGLTVVKTAMGCVGSARQPCPRTVESATKALAYAPSTMAQGENWLKVTATDPIGQKSAVRDSKVKVDHTSPTLALSGTMTEQATLGTKLPSYTLKYAAADGDAAGPEALPSIGSAGTGAGQFQRDGGVAVDSTGNIFVVDRLNNRVTKFDSSGNLLLQFGTLGNANGQLNDPRGIAIGESGNLWVADFANNRVQKFSPSGTYLGKIALPVSSNPYAVAAGPGGVIWIVDQTGKRVWKCKEDGTILGLAEGTQATPSGPVTDLLNPVGAAVDAFGNVWVVDQGNSKIREFSPAGKFLFEFGTEGTAEGKLNHPRGIAIAPSGHLLITDESHRIQVFMPDGTFLRQFGTNGSGSGQLFEPQGLAVGAGNKIYVADAGNKRVARWAHADLDNQSGVAGTSLKIDGQLVEPKYQPGCATKNCTINREWLLDAGDYSVGQHTAEVIAFDEVGLSTTKALTFETNIVPPKIDLSGTITEQASLGSTRPHYKLKVDAMAGSGGEGLAAPRSGLVAAYSFDDGTGSVVHDLAGDHDGAIEGADWAQGKYGKGLNFDADAHDILRVASADDLHLSEELTVEAWVRPGEDNIWAPILMKQGSEYPEYSYFLFGGAAESNIPFGAIAADGEEEEEEQVFGLQALPESAWSHLAMTSDGAHMRLYVNGTLVDTGPALTPRETSGDLTIGGADVFNDWFEGRIDEVRIYNRALSGTEVAADRDAPMQTHKSQPVAAYSFDEGTGAVAHDLAGDHDGTIEGADWAQGKYGGGLNFDADAHDLLRVTSAEDLHLSEELTLEAWVRPGEDNIWAPIMMKQGSEYPEYSYFLFGGAEESNLPFGAIAADGEEEVEEQVYGIEALPEETWSHLAMTSDGAHMRLYVNGTLVDTGPALTPRETSGDLTIGAADVFNDWFEGRIDEVRIYNRALSGAEVAADRDAPIGPGAKVSTEITFDGQVVDSDQASCVGAYCPITSEWDLNAATKSAGSHQAVAKVTDGLGVTRSKSLTINIAKDTTPPTISAANAFYNAPEGWLEQKSYAVNATAEDEMGFGVTSMTLKIDGQTVRSNSQECGSGACALNLASAEPIAMNEYEGGAHPAELRVVDGAGNFARKVWTINVDPKGSVSNAEAEDTLEAVEETAEANLLGETAVEPDIDGTVEGLDFGHEGEDLYVDGNAVPTFVGTDPADGLKVEVPVEEALDTCLGEGAEEQNLTGEEEEDLAESPQSECAAEPVQADPNMNLLPVEITPVSVSPGATETEITDSDAAALATDVTAHVDLVTRPLYDGAMTFAAIRDAAAPGKYEWEVQLEPEQELVQIDSQHAQVRYEDGVHIAVGITATPAHDAIGSSVPTSLTVSGNVLTLLVDHTSGSPAGGSFVYPVVAGVGWEGGFHTYQIEMPPPEEEPGGEEEEASFDGAFIRILTMGAPEASSSVTEANPGEVTENRKRFKFTMCYPHNLPSDPIWDGKLFEDPVWVTHRGAGEPDREKNLPRVVSECHREDFEGVFWGTTVFGAFHYVFQNRVRVESDEWNCKSWGEEKPAKINCRGIVFEPRFGQKKWVKGPIYVVGDFRWGPMKGTPIKPETYATCFTQGGALYPNPRKALDQPVERPMIVERSYVLPIETCNWPWKVG